MNALSKNSSHAETAGSALDALNAWVTSVAMLTHPDAIHAGAIGAALWGAFRYDKLQARGQLGGQAAGRAA